MLYICDNVYIPLRSGPSHKSEMLSQVLFGETFRITDHSGSWIKLETQFDSYQGWADSNHLQLSEFIAPSSSYVLNRSLICVRKDKTLINLEPGCELHDIDPVSGTFMNGKNRYSIKGEDTNLIQSEQGSLPETGIRFLNSPYLWGGRIPSGIDCSGLIQLVYKIHGIAMPRDSGKQAEMGKNIDFIDAAEPGDLVFFDNEKGVISHVGMIISPGIVIHASGRVRIDRIDHQGIFKYETGSYSHRLRLIKRIK